MSNNLITLLPLVKQFRQRFLSDPVTKYSYQYLFDRADDVSYLPPYCSVCKNYSCDLHPKKPLSDQDLLEHFSGKGVSYAGGLRSGLAVIPLQNGRFKWFVVDSDNIESTVALNKKLIPVLKKYNIEYIYEYGSTEEKCHIWFLVDCSKEILQDFTRQLFEEADIDYEGRDRELNLEVYPTNKPTSLIRIPGGFHLRNKKVNPIIYKDVLSSDVEFILKSFCEVKQYSEQEIQSLLKPITIKSSLKPVVLRDTVPYVDRHLPINYDVPTSARKLVGNCQAINSLLDKIVNDKYLNGRGWNVHTAGLYIANAFAKVDQVFKDRSESAKKWILETIDEHRDRDAKSHRWFYSLSRRRSTAKMPSCSTWNRDVKLCEGCPFKDKIESPYQFISGRSEIKPIKISDIELKSVEDIRDKTFKRIEERVLTAATTGEKLDLLLASPLGAGKTFKANEIAAKLAKEGKNILIAVPTAKLALQHRKTLMESFGYKPFVLMSHNNIFKKDGDKRRFGLDFDCPYSEEIKRLNDLGVSSSFYRKSFCGKCKYKEGCPYPGQYSRAKETDSKILIIQHAHFSCRETMFSLLTSRRWDVLIIDEEFIDSLVKEFRISDQELLVLERFQAEIPWTKRLFDWFNEVEEEEKFKPIVAKENELENLFNAFSEKLLPWNVPEYISYFNYQHKYSKDYGFFIFNPLPNIPIRMFTDATPPVEILKIVLNNDIQIFGKNEIMDYTKINPKNKIIQYINVSSSKTYLEKEEWNNFYESLDKVCKDIMRDYVDWSPLIVTYSGEHTERAKSFIRKNYKELVDKVLIHHMAIGTNEFSHCRVMFQLAGLHYNSRQLAFNAYKIKSIENYWKRLSNRPEVDNPYPINIAENSPIDLVAEPVIRAEIGSDGPGLYQYPYPQFRTFRPTNKYYYYSYLLSLAKRQQAMRIRFNDGQEKHAFLFDSGARDTLLIRESRLY